ncbi:hypothetical protein GCM10009641_48290 [Mycobacterium cookii]|uniref:Uncharacterized protein n=2 Tax=Mycobacterium cookii TaxID=1775 RepID=A0A7I7KWE5_9MYCO|nr:hypothetical protein [Mycobacterium cookii]BBX46243.1 hypothetical protein MCOO_22580 [Mycobacterium cookii]
MRAGGAPQTGIIRRAPTGAMPVVEDTRTTHIPRQAPPPRPVSPPPYAPAPAFQPSAAPAIAAAAVSIVSGWATSVVATELIAGWWHSDRLFCVAVAFLGLVFAMATVGGVILLLLRQTLGRYLIVAGAVVAILTYLGVFIAGARVAWIVHTLPLLPIASAVLTMLPRTRDWLLDD